METTTQTTERTAAEYLMDLATEIKHPRDLLVLAQAGMGGWHLAQSRLAMEFDAKPLAFKFRAVFEEWTQDKIIREMY